jgi:hypothetical protein
MFRRSERLREGNGIINEGTTMLDFKRACCIKNFEYMPGHRVGKIEDVKVLNGTDIFILDQSSPYLYFFKVNPGKNSATFK